MSEDKYKRHLKIKLEATERINNNLILQCEALKSNNIKLLGKLLKRQQRNIDKLKQIEKSYLLSCNFEKDAEIKQLENSVDSLFEVAIKTIILNISNAEKLKNELAISIYNLKVNRNAIKNGYFKKGYQQHGYFIDKKIGK